VTEAGQIAQSYRQRFTTRSNPEAAVGNIVDDQLPQLQPSEGKVLRQGHEVGSVPDHISSPLGSPIPFKRRRKSNDSPPPNRARDIQRAFRARRAAYVIRLSSCEISLFFPCHSLEQEVSRLNEENARLRKMVGWPPSIKITSLFRLGGEMEVDI
jgi:hypothetical protein